MQFQLDWPKDKKITAILIFCLNTEQFRSTELNDVPPEGSTIFFSPAPRAVRQWQPVE